MSFNLYGPLNDLSYGIVTRGLLGGLLELNINDFHLNPIGQVQVEDQVSLQPYINNIRNVYWNRENASIAVWHEFDLSKFSGKKLIAMPIFETNDFFPQAKVFLSQMDSIFVLSSWAKKVLHESIGNQLKIFVVPAAANIINSPEVEGVKKNYSFTFINVGKFEKRKSPSELIQAYLHAFSTRKYETRLRIHCFNPFDQNFVNTVNSLFNSLGLQQVNSINKNHCIVGMKGNAIVEIPLGRLTATNLAQLYKNSHIGVFPSKAEGWNLPLMESIQYGLPCIATNYSAHTEYLSSEYDYPQELLLNKLGMEVAVDGVWFHGDRGSWCTPNIEELAEKMVYSYENYDKIISSFNNTKIKNTFTWRNTAMQFINSLNQV